MAAQEFVVLTELLMLQLLKLDTIEAIGEAKVQRRIEVGENLFLCQTSYLSLSLFTNIFLGFSNLIQKSWRTVLLLL